MHKWYLSVIHIEKDENGFDCVYGKEELSTICIDHKMMLQLMK